MYLPTDSHIYNIFYILAIEPYHARDGDQEVLPLPELLDDEEEYEVEEVLRKERRRGAMWYLVKWKGWPEEYNEWLPEDNMANAQGAVHDFEQQQAQRTSQTRRGRPRKM